MSPAKTCARCAVPLPDDVPEGAVCNDCIAAIEAEQTMATPVDGTPSPLFRLPAEAPRTEVIGDFEILDKLGQGGMGAVYRARQITLDRIVALKVLPEQAQQEEGSVSRFEREAKVAASLVHPNLVRVYASGAIDGAHFIAMELVEGENLHQRLKRGALDVTEAVRICADVARALQCGWETAQLIHRDIKPSNIYLSHDGAVKLGDLGIAKSLLANTTGLTQTGTTMGTPHYISPEQARADKNLDFRADIYSLGCTLFQCLTGRTPYIADNAITLMSLHRDAPPPALLKVLPGCPIPLARLVGKMLKKHPRERHLNYCDLITEMEQVREQIESGVTATRPSKVVEAWKQVGDLETKPGASYGLLWAGFAALLLVGGGVAWLAMQPERPKSASAAAMKATASPVPRNTSVATSEAATAASALVKLWDTPEKFAPTSGVEWVDGAIRLNNNSLTHIHQDSIDVILRASIRMNPDSTSPEIGVRSRGGRGEVERYTLGFTKAGIRLLRWLNSNPTTLGFWPYPRSYRADEWVRLELKAVGHELTASADGRILGVVRDDSVNKAGRPLIRALANGYFRDIEYIPLDGVPEAEALKLLGTISAPTTIPAATTKDAPFVNTLGMQFVPVPIIGGPTDGKRVLFSVWETRVQDYEAFAKETQREWPTETAQVAPTSPATQVSWEDASAFGVWLTQREQKSGRLGTSECYRLPSDHEWSCAVGIGGEEDAARLPGQKNSKLENRYPWGAAWPPPAGAGNFRGEESQPGPGQPVIPGYRDPFRNVAPVGGFAANDRGLFDLSGNVWEWVEDWETVSQETRVTRGGSAHNGTTGPLLASSRSGHPPSKRAAHVGFRIVLAPAP